MTDLNFGHGLDVTREAKYLTIDVDESELQIASGNFTDEKAQDAVGTNYDATLTYDDVAPSFGVDTTHAFTWTGKHSFDDTATFGDDVDLEFGQNSDFSIGYNSTNDEWRLRDKAGNQDLFVIDSNEIFIGDSRDIHLQSGTAANLLVGRASDGHIGIGTVAQDNEQVVLDAPAETVSSNQSFHRFDVATSGALTIQGSTTSPHVTAMRVQEPNIDASAGSAVVTEATTLHVPSAPTEGDSNYGYLQEAGDMALKADNAEFLFGAGDDYGLRFNGSAFEFVDKANADVEAKFHVGGGIEFTNQTIESKLNEGEDLFKLVSAATGDDARFRWATGNVFELNVRDSSVPSTTSHITIDPTEAFMRIESDFQFDGITGTPRFSTHDHSAGGMAAVDHSNLANVTSDQHHAQSHDNTDHTTKMVEDATGDAHVPHEIQIDGTDGNGIINFKTT